MLTERECKLIEKGLTEAVEPRKVAAYLCLHMGLMLSETAALRRQDIDLENKLLIVHSYVGKPEGSTDTAELAFLQLEQPLILPMPAHVVRYLRSSEELYRDGECFIMSGGKTVPAFHLMQNILTSIRTRYRIEESFSASDLRNAFIRRCIESGMDLYSICEYVGIRQPNVIANRFREYFTPRLDDVGRIEKYAGDYIPAPAFDPKEPKRMNLLILGAGSQGPVVREIAEEIGIFEDIAFLDDDPANKLAIGPLKDMEKLVNTYPMATASFGDSYLRKTSMDALERLGYIVPSLIHPDATVSPDAKLGRSVMVEARCIVSAGANIGRGAILSGASVIEANGSIGRFVHIGSSAIVSKGSAVSDYERIPSGTVIRPEAE